MEAFQIRSRSAYHMKACDVTWRWEWPSECTDQPPVPRTRPQPSFIVTAFVSSTTTAERFSLMHTEPCRGYAEKVP